MTDLMYDGAYDANEVAAAKAAGAIAMSHYLTGTFATSSAQPAAIRAAGLGAVLNWELAANALVGATRAQGQQIAQDALAAVDPACPRDGSVGIYFSVDVNVAMSSVAVCDEAFRGLNDVLAGKFRVKTYAEGAVIDHLVSLGLAQGKQWLSASSSFPGYNPTDSNVCMVQQVGTDVPNTDKNIITDPHAVDAWWPANSPYGVDMALLADERAALFEIRDELRGGVAPGQITEGGTIAATLQTVQRIVNLLAGVTTSDAATTQSLADVKSQLSNMAAGTATVDPVALAQAIAAHVTLAAH